MRFPTIHPSLLSVGIITLAALPSQDASAAASAKAALNNVTITLVDLDPHDGIAPALSFSASTSLSNVSADPLNNAPQRPSPDVSIRQFNSVETFLGSSNATVGLAGLTARATTTPTTMVAEAATLHGSASVAAQSFVSYITDFDLMGFTLTPQTAFTIGGDASLLATSDGVSTGPSYWQNSYAEAYVDIALSTADGFPAGDPSAQEVLVSLLTPWQTPVSLQESRPVSLTLTNPTPDVLHGRLGIGTSVIVASPVPEAGTSALTAGGLGLMWAWRRANGARGRGLRRPV